jgi:hypothetical protein
MRGAIVADLKTRPRENYESAWEQLEDAAGRVVASGERELSRAVRRVEAEWRATSTLPVDGTSFGTAVTLPHASLIGAKRDLIMRVVLDACTSQTTMVVELGSGWGNNLLDLYLWGGPKVRYFGLEPTRSGRACVSTLAALAPDLELVALPFDYEQPRYDDLPRDNEHVVVLTCMSIEQIPELPREAISGLFVLGESLTVVHFEPLGWQIRGGPESEKAHGYALRRGYNRNLWPLLNELVDAGELMIDTVVPDMIGNKRKQSSTLVVWHRPVSDG